MTDGLRMSLAEAEEIVLAPKLLRKLLAAAEVELARSLIDCDKDKIDEQRGIIKGVRLVKSIILQADKMVRDKQLEATEPAVDVLPPGFLALLMKPEEIEDGQKSEGGG